MTLGEKIAKGYRIVKRRLKAHGVGVSAVWLLTRVYLKALRRPYLPYSRITRQIYVGGQVSGGGWRYLEKRGLTADVNMREEFDDAARGIAPPAYCWLPTPDDHAPTIEQLEQGVGFIRRQIGGGGKVYIHCAGGIGRAPTMAAAYLVSTGLPLKDAVSLIERTRPFIWITEAQMERLRQFEAHVNGQH